MKTLKLTLKRQWFDMIASGTKTEEYREIAPWILSRLQGKTYGAVEFSNGYGAHVPKVTVEFLGWGTGVGRAEWGATPGKPTIIIRLGKIISPQPAEKLSTQHNMSNPLLPPETAAFVEEHLASRRVAGNKSPSIWLKMADFEHRLLLAKDEIRAIDHTIVVTVGGTCYEGTPTSEINWLQRLRILMSKEKLLDEAADMLDALRKDANSSIGFAISTEAQDLRARIGEFARAPMCPHCEDSGLTHGWVPSYNNPDNAGGDDPAEPCFCPAGRKRFPKQP